MSGKCSACNDNEETRIRICGSMMHEKCMNLLFYGTEFTAAAVDEEAALFEVVENEDGCNSSPSATPEGASPGQLYRYYFIFIA